MKKENFNHIIQKMKNQSKTTKDILVYLSWIHLKNKYCDNFLNLLNLKLDNINKIRICKFPIIAYGTIENSTAIVFYSKNDSFSVKPYADKIYISAIKEFKIIDENLLIIKEKIWENRIIIYYLDIANSLKNKLLIELTI